MFSIKNSFANCSICSLLNEPSCILETNCDGDLTKVDVVFVAENPGKNEIEKETPLVGKAGQMFRKYFRKFDIDKMNYLLTNTVLCQTLKEDGTTGTPDEETVELCKINCMSIIKMCNPKLVVLMGSTPMSAFGFGKHGITNMVGNVVNWEGYKTLITIHPSFVNRRSEIWEPKFEESFKKVSEILTGTKIKTTSTKQSKKEKGIHRYKIDDKFYTDEYRLIDIQYIHTTKQVLYIFRDKNNNKVYHKENDNYVCYQVPTGEKASILKPFEQLDQIWIKEEDRSKLDSNITYEGDVRITVKHAMDYYFYNKGECKKVLDNIMFCDIEVDTGKDKVFPKPTDANYPINLISVIYNGKKICYIVDNKTEPITPKENAELKIFTNEKAMMSSFIKDFKTFDPDFIAGWNVISFDLEYIFNRLSKIGIDKNSMSKFGEFNVRGEFYFCKLIGTVVVDQLFLYKTFTFTKLENYKLGFVSQHELGITKIELPLDFNEMYWKMLNTTIEYNIRDTELLEKLEHKLSHINLLNELRIICNTSFEACTSFGEIDSMMVSYLKGKGLSCKNADPNMVKEDYPGAYVYEPHPDVYDWITDFDFASLYPSLMITYNIGVNSFIMKTVDPHLGYELTYDPSALPENINVIIDPLCDKIEMKVPKDKFIERIKKENLVYTINGCFFKPHKEEFSVFGEVVDMLMKTRKKYKKQMFDAVVAKDKELEKFYNTRQLVYKVLANTLYGVVANKSFRFYDNSLAAAITLSGQEALKSSIINADALMRHLDYGKSIVEPKTLTKKEMFATVDSQEYFLPDRSHEYIVTGDTDSIFCCFQNFIQRHEITVKNILEWCGKIEHYLNKEKIIDMVKLHQVDLDFNRLVLKNELVISRGLFLAKKRYAIRVIANEGKEVDKINYMGLETKRSDYPSKSKEFLKELIDLLFKTDKISLTKILEYCKKQEVVFRNLVKNGDKSIARPVSYTKDLEDYKAIPQNIVAFENWNKIMYDIHKPGTKGYMFYISGINDTTAPPDVMKRYNEFIKSGKKLEVIAIPDNESKLPEYFLPNVRTSMRFSFTDRYELLLKPLIDVKLAMENKVMKF